MDRRKYTAMKRYLAERQQSCLAHQETLQADGRADEGVFERIRANVFGVAEAVLKAADAQKEPEQFFRMRMEQIPAAWEKSLEQAQFHGDAVKAHLEKIKLEAAEEIRTAFDRIWSDEA
ncbi:MAG: hypothetical protein IJ507_04005 [Clostridia bacterium]|nr:hypothetical protein [Clostridia bacterium]